MTQDLIRPGATPSFPGFSRFGPNDRLRPIGPIWPARDIDSKVNGAGIRSQSQRYMDRMPVLKKRQRLYPKEPCHHLPPVSSLSQHHQRSRPALQFLTPRRLGLRTLEAIAPATTLLRSHHNRARLSLRRSSTRCTRPGNFFGVKRLCSRGNLRGVSRSSLISRFWIWRICILHSHSA